jgi:hypothetical protein
MDVTYLWFDGGLVAARLACTLPATGAMGAKPDGSDPIGNYLLMVSAS